MHCRSGFRVMTYASWQSFDTKCTKNPATLPARGGPSQKRFDQEWRRRPSQRRARKGEDFERQFTTPVVTLHARDPWAASTRILVLKTNYTSKTQWKGGFGRPVLFDHSNCKFCPRQLSDYLVRRARGPIVMRVGVLPALAAGHHFDGLRQEQSRRAL
jgi:hypothetical protein